MRVSEVSPMVWLKYGVGVGVSVIVDVGGEKMVSASTVSYTRAHINDGCGFASHRQTKMMAQNKRVCMRSLKYTGLTANLSGSSKVSVPWYPHGSPVIYHKMLSPPSRQS